MADSPAVKQQFPPNAAEKQRLKDYQYYEKLFLGEHFDAFNMRVESVEYNKAYSQLRYVMVNFAGLLSRVCADMLFGESVSIKTKDGDVDFIESLWYENKLDTVCYESELENSALGDTCFKVRVGKRNPGDTEDTVIIEAFTPRIYFPQLDPFNISAPPKEVWLEWTFMQNDIKYLRREIHKIGSIENQIWQMEDEDLKADVSGAMLSKLGLEAKQDTSIKSLTVTHIPNYKTPSRHYGLSDYKDLTELFFAINNRLTKVDNILDKHSDPILMVPPGVLDDKGKPRKKDGRIIEMGEDSEGKPEYVVWDASLENAFKELESLIKTFEMVAEISPDVFGMGTGQADSGRALKFKLMRTIAKISRKRQYYKPALEQVLYIAQELAKAKGIKMDGKTLQGDPVYPEIEFADGLPIDISEELDNEIKAIDAKLTSTKDAIMRVYDVDEKEAEKRVKDIKAETAIDMPAMNLGNGNTPNANGKPNVNTPPANGNQPPQGK